MQSGFVQPSVHGECHHLAPFSCQLPKLSYFVLCFMCPKQLNFQSPGTQIQHYQAFFMIVASAFIHRLMRSH